MKMFDYASLIRLLEIGVNPNSQNRLIVCENESAKKSYIKRHEVFRTEKKPIQKYRRVEGIGVSTLYYYK